MVEAENRAAIPSGSFAPVDPNSGFVQLSTDTQRSTAIGYERAYASVRPLKQSSEAGATVVGALCALLFRYTQQESIGLDLYQCEPIPTTQRSGSLRCTVTADQPLSAVIAQAEMAIVALREAASEQRSAATSNVAVSFVGAGDALDTSDSHDVHFVIRAQSSTLEIAYNARLFQASTIERLAEALVRIFELALEQPATPIERLPVLSAGDLQTITVEWDSGHAEYAQEPVHRVFEQLARQRPEAFAASFEGRMLTYGELDARSSQLARYLIGCGVTPGGAVAVCVLPSLDIVVAFLAIWKAGAVYVPLDPTHPEALVATILDEVQPGVVLTQSKLRPLTNPQRHAQFCFDSDSHLIQTLPISTPMVKVTLEDRAYVLYTSGTTGKPKGVDARHSNLAHYIRVARQLYGFRHDDVFCSLARYTFSISLFELVLPLCCGASLKLLVRDDVLAPERLARTLSEVTVVHAGPSLLGNLFRYLRSNPSSNQTFPRMRHASSGGDLVPPTVIEEMKHVFRNAELFVIYGCTEISCMGCTYPIRWDQKVNRTFVGKAFPDVVVRVTDPAGNLVPFGVVGEICFAGKGVVRGYLHRPELTSEKFIEREGQRFYTTGDMGRLHPDGNVEILGRRDYQVQLRGIRVELPGIENAVREIALAEQCAMAVKKLDEQDVRLVAFVVKPRETAIAAFRRALAAHLPDYMLPQSLVTIDTLPLTRNGKLDRSALQDLPWENLEDAVPRTIGERQIATEAQGFFDRTEQQLAELFRQLLRVKTVSLRDDFFDLGGHSLLAVRLLTRIEQVFKRAVPLPLLFQSPTVEGLAKFLRGEYEEAAKKPSAIVPLNAQGDGLAFFCVHSVGGEAMSFRHLANLLKPECRFYGLAPPPEMRNAKFASSIEDMARYYVDALVEFQPDGPYLLGGWSAGSMIALEMAQQLQATGREVKLVVALDGTPGNTGVRASRWNPLYYGKLLCNFPYWIVDDLLVDFSFTASVRRVWKKISSFAQKTIAKLYGKSDWRRFEVDGFLDISAFSVNQAEFMRTLHISLHQYVPKPYSGSVVLYVATTQPLYHLLDVEMPWRKVAAEIDVVHVRGTHVSLIDEPYVRAIAKDLLARLAKIRYGCVPIITLHIGRVEQ